MDRNNLSNTLNFSFSNLHVSQLFRGSHTRHFTLVNTKSYTRWQLWSIWSSIKTNWFICFTSHESQICGTASSSWWTPLPICIFRDIFLAMVQICVLSICSILALGEAPRTFLGKMSAPARYTFSIAPEHTRYPSSSATSLHSGSLLYPFSKVLENGFHPSLEQ